MPISLQEGLSVTEDKSTPFSIEFVTASSSKKESGKVIELPSVVRIGSRHSNRNNDSIVVRPTNGHHPYTIHNYLILKVNGEPVFI